MSEFFSERRFSSRHKEQFDAGQAQVETILPQLKPSEQGIVKLLYGLEGEQVHSREAICKRYPDVSLADLALLVDKIERMIAIHKRETHGSSKGLVNVKRPKRTKEVDEEFGEEDEHDDFDLS